MSSDYKIKISEPTAVRLREQAEALGITVNTHIAQLIEAHPAPTPTPQATTADEAAEYFLGQLEPEHRKLIEDCARDAMRHPASYIMSYIKLAHDQGNTAKSLPEALDQTVNTVAPVALSNKSCEWCQKPLENRNARFCNDPTDGSESCGRQASLYVLRESRRKKLTGNELPHPTVMDRHIKV